MRSSNPASAGLLGESYVIIILFVLVCFLASVAGCICGIGGGIIIKPVLDSLGVYPAATISFISSCIVLSMTCYTVVNATLSGESMIRKGISTFLGLGAALGGVLGKVLFDFIQSASPNANMVGAVQSALLFVVMLGTLTYMLYSAKISNHSVTKRRTCVLIGFGLGLLSSFLGIGGGPINLVVLSFFFSMNTKEAAQNSLFIILLSQCTSLILTLATGTVPEFPVLPFTLMVTAGIMGGVAGRRINKHLDGVAVGKLLNGLIIIIMLVCAYNFWRYCQ